MESILFRVLAAIQLLVLSGGASADPAPGLLERSFSEPEWYLSKLNDPKLLGQVLRHDGSEIVPFNETFLKLDRAWVVLADYSLIQKDFPEVKPEDIDAWLVDQAALTSEYQFGHQQGQRYSDDQKEDVAVSEGIRVKPNVKVRGYRPTEYGRAAVIPVSYNGNDIGLIDVKGIGRHNGASDSTSKSFNSSHGNGLHVFDLAIRELYLEKATARILAMIRQRCPFSSEDPHDVVKSLMPHFTVGTYAILMTDFTIINKDGRSINKTAGLVLRQAHSRKLDSVPAEYYLKMRPQGLHAALRKFGVAVEMPLNWEEVSAEETLHDCNPRQFRKLGLSRTQLDEIQREQNLVFLKHDMSKDYAIVDFGTWRLVGGQPKITCADAVHAAFLLRDDLDLLDEDKYQWIWLPGDIPPDPRLMLPSEWDFSYILDSNSLADEFVSKIAQDLFSARDDSAKFDKLRLQLAADLERRLALIKRR